MTVGNPEFIEHDWFTIFSSLGLLRHDTQIAAMVRIAGWMGMLSVIVWLARRGVVTGETAPNTAQ